METNFTDNKEDYMLTDSDNSSAVAVWLFVDLFLFLYYLTFLLILWKKHQDHIQPVHILTLNTLVDVTIAVFIYFTHELLVVLTGTGLTHVVMFDNLFGFLLSLDVIAQDLDGLLFVSLDAYYHECITNTVSVVIVIMIKVFGTILVGIIHIMCPSASPPDITKIFFYKKTLYLFAIPNTFWFFISLTIIGYMTYTKYRLSLGVAPQNNIRPSHIPSVSGRLNQDRIPPTAIRLAWQYQSEPLTSASQIGVSFKLFLSNQSCFKYEYCHSSGE